MHKVRSAVLLTCLLTFMLIGKVSNFLPQIEASPLALSTSDDGNIITVENDYYIAKFDKSDGQLNHFYIKPDDTVDIVTSSFSGKMGSHEVEAYNGSSSSATQQWTSVDGEVTNDTLEWVYQTNDVATIYMNIIVNDTDCSWGLFGYNITQFFTFYADKPYFLVTSNRYYLANMNFLYEQQTCFLFDPSWAEGFKATNAWGDIVHDATTLCGAEDSCSFFPEGIDKFPWWYAYNSTYGSGFGTILLSSFPNHAKIGCYFLSGLGYAEYQITQNMYTSGMLANQENSFTYINYVASNETEVDTFSQNLYRSMSHAPSGRIYTAVNDREHVSFGGFKKPHSVGLKLTTINRINPYVIGDKNLMRYEPILINSSGTYTVNGGYTTLTITERVFNSTYARLVFRYDNCKLRWYEIWESYHNADVVKVTYNVTTTDTQNVTDIYLRIRELYPYANSDQIALDSNTIKVNASSAFSDWIADNGIAIKQVSGNGTEISGVYNNFYVENGTSDTEYGNGTFWQMVVYYQGFMRTDRDFTISDFLSFGSGNTDIFSHMKNAYIPLPFPNFPTSTNATLFVKYIGRATHQIPYSTYAANRLTLIIAGVSGKTSTTQIYVGGKGEPTAVYAVGANVTWNYNARTAILTLNVTYTSPARILIYWKLPGDVDGNGIVDIFDIGSISAHWYPGPPIGPLGYAANYDLNLDGAIDIYEIGIVSTDWGQMWAHETLGSEWLNCNAYDSTYTAWIVVGTSPYLNAQDQLTNYVHKSSAQAVNIGWFNFPSTTLTGPLKVNISVYCNNDDGVGDDYANVYVDYTGSGAGTDIGDVAQHTDWQYDTIDLGVHTVSEVNNLRVYLEYQKVGGADDIRIDHIRIGVLDPG